jgi:spore maturation protein CgeB
VVHSQYYSLPRLALRVVSERLIGIRPTREQVTVLQAARRFRPQVVLSLTRGLHPEILEALGKECGAQRVLWWGDPPGNSTRWGLLDEGWDLVLIKDAQAVTKLRLAGRNAHLLHEAMNPRWHKPVAQQANERVAVVGNSYAFRQAVCVRLLESGFDLAIHGSRPPVWSHPVYRRAHTGVYVVREQKSRVFGEALGCLNTFSLSEGNSLNCRAFEIAGAGGLQLIEARPAIQDCFEAGRELLTFSTFDQLLEHLERARRDPVGIREVREAGTRRALAEHTYRHRLERLFGLLEEG